MILEAVFGHGLEFGEFFTIKHHFVFFLTGQFLCLL